MTGLGPEVLDLAQRRWTWAKGTGLGPNALDLQVLPSPAKSSLDLTGNDWTWQEYGALPTGFGEERCPTRAN